MSDMEATPGRDAVMKRTAARVRSALAWRNIKFAEAARTIGVTQPYLNRRVNADVPLNVVDLSMLADLVGVTPGQLLDGEPWPDTPAAEVTTDS